MALRRLIAPLVFGLGGAAILIGLGFWQVQRLSWKEGVLAEIDARIAAPPVALPEAPDADRDRFLPVQVAGRFTGEALDVLTSRKGQGAGFRIVAVMETDAGRRILIDRGFLPEARRADPRAEGPATVTGNLHWPDDKSSSTPPPDLARGIWFSRDVADMAAALDTEPVLVVLRAGGPQDGVTPMPLDTSGIPNDHLGYAVTWFLLAVVWLGMTVLLVWRIWRRSA